MRQKRTDEIMILNVGLTNAESERVKFLMEHFKKKYLYEVVAELINYIPALEQVKINIPTKSMGETFNVRSLRLLAKDYEIIDKYAMQHFRDKNNTIRYFINAAYQLINEE